MAAEPELTAEDLAYVYAISGDEPETDTWTPVDLNDLPEEPPVKPDLGQTRIVYPGKRHVFSGPPESAKTLAAYCILIQVVRLGGLGILIDFEMGGYDARQRLRELGATPGEISRILYLEPDEPATPARIAKLVTLQPVLVVIDAAVGAYQLEGLDDNKRGDVERLSRLYVGAFWRNAIATIMVDHVVKNSEERGRFVIGSERKLGGSDVHLGFEIGKPVQRGSKGLYKIITHKDRGGYLKRGHLADLHLDSDTDTHKITWRFTEAMVGTAAGRLTNLMERVSRHLELQTESVTRNEIDRDVTGNRKHLFQAVDSLVNEGFATEISGTNNRRLVASVRNYREDDPACNPEELVGATIFSSEPRPTSDSDVFTPTFDDDIPF